LRNFSLTSVALPLPALLQPQLPVERPLLVGQFSVKPMFNPGGGKEAMVTLAEELLLLAMEDGKSTVLSSAAATVPYALAGAILAELILHDKIQPDQNQRLSVEDGSCTCNKEKRLNHRVIGMKLLLNAILGWPCGDSRGKRFLLANFFPRLPSASGTHICAVRLLLKRSPLAPSPSPPR
jgi:hypothetical protein